MRKTKAALVIGVILIILGLVLVFAVPASVTWKPKSEVLADEKSLLVAPRWNSTSKELTDQVLTVPTWSTYDYGLVSPHIYEDAKDFVIEGTAVEQSSPQLWFNFYIFDSPNFDLWKEGKSYEEYYEDTQGKTSLSFSFSIATDDELPGLFYFVIEPNVVGVKPTVRVNATISWIEKTPLYSCSKYFLTWEFTFEETKDFVLKGNATEVGSHEFNFYIFDSSNYFDWKADELYTAFYEKKGVTSTSFNVSLTEDEAESIIYFAVENPLTDIEETVKVSAEITYQEKATIAGALGGLILGGIVGFIGFIILIISAVAHFISKPESKPKA